MVYRYNPGDTVTLSCPLIDEETPANNPVTGETVQVAIRRGSDDYWWDFVASTWDNLTYATLEASNWATHDDKGDGCYETDWDQGSADPGAIETYFAKHRVATGSGDWDERVDEDELVFDLTDANTTQIEGVDATNQIRDSGKLAISAYHLDHLLLAGGTVDSSPAPTTTQFQRESGSDPSINHAVVFVSGALTSIGRRVVSSVGGLITVDPAFPSAPAYLDQFVYTAFPVADTNIADAIAAIGPGSGENVVNITVSDGTDPVPGARVYIKNTETGDYQYGADANTNGIATFQLDDGTYWVKVNADGYAHSAEQVTVDESPEAITVTVSGIEAPAAGDNPACLRVYTYIRDDDNADLIGADEGFMKVVHYEIPAFVGGDLIAPYTDSEAETDATGLVYLDLIRGSTYTLDVGTSNFSRQFTGVVPTAAAYADDTIALSALVSSTYGWEPT